MENIFNLDEQQLIDIAKDLQSKIQVGLTKENSEVQCIPTYISPKKTQVTGKTLVLDLGGTNYRVATVDLTEKSAEIHPENGWKKDLSVMKTANFSETNLFQEQADPIYEINRGEEMPIGYCFSFPAESTLDGDAKLIRWTKGVDIKEMINKPVGKPLLDYLNQHTSPKFTGIKVMNDTVSSLFGGLTDPGYDAYIGLIVGTGTNMAAFMPTNKIKKINPAYTGNLVPVNLESGNLYPPHLTAIDDKVDASTTTKGAQRFEKAVSGMYLGEILKNVFPNDQFDPKFDAQKLTNIISYPDIYKKEYVDIAMWIYKRSADLVAASIAGLILEMVEQTSSIKKIRLVAEGSLFWSTVNGKGKDYHTMVSEQLKTLLSALKVDVSVDINQMENANLIGSAIAALS